MRLLERQSDGGFRLTDDILDKDISRYPYAILSHRWGQASEEVTFEDMIHGSGREKAGYEKIRFCGEQAAMDGLKYFWVDSCCIRKSSDAELSEAINSMYRWYSRAARCYAYMSDVCTTKRSRGDMDAQSTWESAFRASEWFLRGWTLQELLAPGLVEFFSRERKRLGDKISLSQTIHEITGIAIPALHGICLSQFSVEERFKWAQNRRTTREEDWAYSLLGIFGTSMPLIYGEGRDRSIGRLRKEINEA
ncbi:heterokaryon incompatibility, partial [Lojkania enalia]